MGDNKTSLLDFTHENMDLECHNIANWWIEHSLDTALGGFHGEIKANNEVVADANKGIILNTRILWFFSQAAKEYANDSYRKIAERSYHYLLNQFDDEQHGGVVWELDCTGKCINGKKQTYAQSFAIYGLSAYYLLTNEPQAIDKALQYFSLIEEHAVDPIHGGYLEAFAENWQNLDDVRLSTKDMNSPKSMNTHIHILEAYTALYRATKNPQVGTALTKLTTLIFERIIDPKTQHLFLFLDKDWSDLSDSFSYGHDIECSWLLWDALNALDVPTLRKKYRSTVIKMAQVCLEQSIGDLGQVCDHFTFADKSKHQDSFWWVQAEALVGFLNAFHLTGEHRYLLACERVWQFTQEQHFDHRNGEWFWLAKREQNPTSLEYKAGFWKGPYHNGRAMMEAAELLRNIESNQPQSPHLNVNEFGAIRAPAN
jgi:mannobiose 2-epimerase